MICIAKIQNITEWWNYSISLLKIINNKMTMENYISFDVAKKLKEKDFQRDKNEVFYYIYSPDGETIYRLSTFGAYRMVDNPKESDEIPKVIYPCVSLSAAQDWLRSKGWEVQVRLNGVRTMYFVEVVERAVNGSLITLPLQFDTYAFALNAGISKALDLLNDK